LHHLFNVNPLSFRYLYIFSIFALPKINSQPLQPLMNLIKTIFVKAALTALMIYGLAGTVQAQTTLTFDETPGTTFWYNNGLGFQSSGSDQVGNTDPMGGTGGHWISNGDAGAGMLSAFGVDINVNSLYMKTSNPGQISGLIIRGYDVNGVEKYNSGPLNPSIYQSTYTFITLNFVRVRKLKFEWTNGGSGTVYIDNLDYCLLPTIDTDPTYQFICPSGGNVTFSIVDYGAFNYQWQEDQGGGFVSLSNGGIYTGVNTSSLNITGATSAMNGWQYRCIAMGSCTPTDTSDPAGIVVDGSVMANLASQTSTLCNGYSDGTATVNVTYGIQPYSYSWSTGGSTTATGTALPAGTHTCTVTNGCLTTTDVQVTITEPSPLSISVASQNDVYCNGASNGSATMSVSGGTGPYLLDWFVNGSFLYTGDPSLTQNGPAGTYSITVTDVNGCSANTGVFLINEPPPLNGTVVSQTNVDCFGNSTGSATVSGTGGTPGYTYNWLSGGTTDTETGLTTGSYSCMITDAYGCQMTFPVNITQPPPLSYSVNAQSNAICNGGTGTANVMGLGGTFSYSFLWSPSGETTSNGFNLPAGTNTLTITDGNGCSTMAMINISEPPAIQPNFTVTDVSCNGAADGAISTSATGGTGTLYYNWIPGGSNAPAITGLAPNNYNLEITDDNGCFLSDFAAVNEPAAMSLTIATTDITCNGANDGTANAVVSGGILPYNYLWNGGSSTAVMITALGPGSNSCMVTDANGCQLTNSGTVNEPAVLSVGAGFHNPLCFGGSDAMAYAIPSGGTLPYTYAWSPGGGTTDTITNLPGTVYTIVLTDANGCRDTNFAIITDPNPVTVSILQTDTACGGSAGCIAQATPGGGTGVYTSYAWSSGGTGATETHLAGQTYTCTVTDDNGCTGNGTVSIFEFTTNITGHISTQSLGSVAAGSGNVYVFKYQPGAAGYDTVSITGIDASSNYLAPNVDSGQFLIKVVLNPAIYGSSIPTYYGNAFQWDSSIVVNHGCIADDPADIEVLELPAATGPGVVSGYILEGDSFGVGLRINGALIPPPHICVPGGPLKGIDVKLGKNPGGGIQARVMTDSTGKYEFTNLPLMGYRIYVDIPNLPMDSTREIVLDASNNVSVQNNYFADSASIYVNPDTVVPVGIYASAKIYENHFSIYPNPARDQLYVSLDLSKAGDVNITLTNALGQAIKTESIPDVSTGTLAHRLDLSTLQLKAGVYFICAVHDNKKYTQRLVVIE
jgi:hypothetical protein